MFPLRGASRPSSGSLGEWLRPWTERSIWKLEKAAAAQDETVPTFEETVARLRDLLAVATEANNVAERLRRAAHVAAWVTQGVVTAEDLEAVAAYEVRLLLTTASSVACGRRCQPGLQSLDIPGFVRQRL